MPDGDYIRFGLTGSWRRVLRSLERRDAQAHTEDLLVKAVAATVRANGGVPELPNVSAALYEACSSDDPIATYKESRPTARRDVAARLLDQAALQVASNMQRSLHLISPKSAAELLARKWLERLAHHAGLDRMVPYLVSHGSYTAPDFNRVVRGLFESGQMGKLARSLVDHPDGDGLRAPRKVVQSRSIDDLMQTDLDEL